MHLLQLRLMHAKKGQCEAEEHLAGKGQLLKDVTSFLPACWSIAANVPCKHTHTACSVFCIHIQLIRMHECVCVCVCVCVCMWVCGMSVIAHGSPI